MLENVCDNLYVEDFTLEYHFVNIVCALKLRTAIHRNVTFAQVFASSRRARRDGILN